MENTIQIGILYFDIQFRVLIFVLVCNKARVVYNLVTFFRQNTSDDNQVVPDVKRS